MEAGHHESNSLRELSSPQTTAGQGYYPVLQLPPTTTLALVLAQGALMLKLTCPQTG